MTTGRQILSAALVRPLYKCSPKFYWCSLWIYYQCWEPGGFFLSLSLPFMVSWPHCWRVSFLKCLVQLLCLPYSSTVRYFWSRRLNLKMLTDCHHFPTPSGQLVQGIWLDYHLRVDYRVSLGDCAALWLSQVLLTSNNISATADLSFFFHIVQYHFTRMLQHEIVRGETTLPFLSACLLKYSERKHRPHKGFPCRSKLLVQHRCY